MFIVISSRSRHSYPDFGRLRNWDEIEAERNNKRKQAHQNAEAKTGELGHEMNSWSNINSSYCKKCGKEAKITDILSRYSTKFTGPAFQETCEHSGYNNSNDNWHWSYNTIME